MYNDVIKLVAETKTTNEYGDVVSTTAERTVFAGVRSVGQNEFYQAHGVGLRPEIKFVLADYLEYHGEKLVVYQAYEQSEPEEYGVIRTYRNGNELEIVCRRGIDE